MKDFLRATVMTADTLIGATRISMDAFTVVVLMAVITNRATEMDVSILKTEI